MTALRAGSAPSGPERPDRLSSRYYTLRFSLRHELDEIARITPAVSDYLASCKVPEATGFKVHLTLEEMLSNLVRHGDGNAPIDVAIANAA